MVLICIAAMLFIVLNVTKVKNESISLKNDYLVQINISNNIESAVNDMILFMKEYELKNDEESLNAVKEKLQFVKNAINEAYLLTDSSSKLNEFRTKLETIDVRVNEYEALFEMELQRREAIEKAKAESEISRVKLIENCNEYMEMTNQYIASMQGQINSVIENQTNIIYYMGEVKYSISNIKAANYEFAVTNDVTKINELYNYYNQLETTVFAISGIEKDQEKLQIFNNIKTGVLEYSKTIKEITDSWISLKKVTDERMTKADDVVAFVQQTAEDGLEITGQTATNTSHSVSELLYICIFSFIFAIGASFTVNIIVLKNIKTSLKDNVDLLNKMKTGDMTSRIKKNSNDELGIMAEALNEVADEISSVVRDIKKTAQQVTNGAEEVMNTSLKVSEGSSSQASSITELNASMSDISVQTKNNVESSEKANNLVNECKLEVKKNNNEMTDMVKSMEDINLASTSILKIIKVIDSISFQTKILSLNAAIEAARAGQYGKGFSVVASEVRNLASKTAEAAKETNELIMLAIKAINNGTELAKKMENSLKEIENKTEDAAMLMDDIALLSTKQSFALEQINQGISMVSHVVQNNNIIAEHSASESKKLTTHAINLNESVSKFFISDDETPDKITLIHVEEKDKKTGIFKRVLESVKKQAKKMLLVVRRK
ncbi:MAG: HAMP domain-containing protein [Clostridia bacterium]|nr:HAMP domain-containing protein [Clostridia bacterium]